MLQTIRNKRPDRLLQKRLISLAYTLVSLTIVLILSFVLPQHFIFLLYLIAGLTLLALILSILTLKAGEKAINYGGFANEIIRHSRQAKRIDDSIGRSVIENEHAQELFNHQNILIFLQTHLSENRGNTLALQRLKNAFQNLSKEKVPLALKLENRLEKEVWYEVSLKPISLKKADLFEPRLALKKIRKDTYLYWSLRDITDERNMEQIFQNEWHNVRDFSDYIPVGLFIYDKNYKIEYCNHAFAEMLQLNREQIIGSDFRKLISPNTPVPPFQKWNESVYFTNKDGNVFETFIRQSSFRDNNEIKIRGAAISDLPNDKTLQQQLSASQDKISWLFDCAPIGILFISPEGVIYESNRQAATFLKTTQEALIDTNLTQIINQSDYHNLRIELDNIKSCVKKSATMEVTFAQTGKTALSYITPMKSKYNNTSPNGFVIYMIDATEQKNLENQFAQAQKMQAVGQLAGGVAHDFNNLLTAIIGFDDLLLQRHGIGDPSFADLIQIKNNANRAAGLVRQLLAFSRKQSMQPRLIDITENFMELSQMLKRVLGEKITLKFHHGEDLGFVKVDPVQFSQVIINLAVNARDAMNFNGILNISTHTEKILRQQVVGNELIEPGEFVVIDVSDTGCGISAENLTHIFEPFFSTKQNVVGSGTGLGLAMVYGIVHQTGGFIKVTSELNKGTTFSIHLPRFEENTENECDNNNDELPEVTTKDGAPVMKVKQQSAPMSVNQKFIFGLNVSAIDRAVDNGKKQKDIRILFVEDEDSVRSFSVRALKKKGYQVTGCNSAENALEQLEKEKDFQLLVTDMVMPGMNGIELSHLVKEKIPNIKIILASGYSEEIVRNELAVDDDFEFMAKPFSLGDLTKKIFDVLNKD